MDARRCEESTRRHYEAGVSVANRITRPHSAVERAKLQTGIAPPPRSNTKGGCTRPQSAATRVHHDMHGEGANAGWAAPGAASKRDRPSKRLRNRPRSALGRLGGIKEEKHKSGEAYYLLLLSLLQTSSQNRINGILLI